MKAIYRSQEGRRQILKQYEQILSFWPPPFAFHHVATDYGDTFVIESGVKMGKPLMLLHGSSSNNAMWMGDAAVLGQTRRVFAVDIIGEPGMSAEARPSMTGGHYACWMQQVMSGLGVDTAAVVGNSLGGWIALDLAARAPERINSLVLLASCGLYPFRKSSALKMLASRLFGGLNSFGKLVIGDVEIPEAVMSYFSLIHREFIPRPLGAPVFNARSLKRLTMPVLYIGGMNDILLNTIKSASRLKRLVPQADIRVLQKSGHTVIDQANEIVSFLAEQEV